MRSLFLLLLFCVLNSSAQETQKDSQFGWLCGNWERTNGPEDIFTTEKWEQISDEVYAGVGISMKNGQVVFEEQLKLFKLNGDWLYRVTGVNEEPTDFKLTTISKNGFTAENPANEFPKIIRYNFHAKNLNAEISGGERTVTFIFKKLDQK